MSFRVHSDEADILFHRLITSASQRLISRNRGCVQNGKWTSISPCQHGQSLRATLSPVLRTFVLADFLLKFKDTGLSSSQQFPASTAGFLHLSQKTSPKGRRCFPDRLLTSLLMHQRMLIKNFMAAVRDSARCLPDAWIFLLGRDGWG